jgi:choice-of-anchor B domain-containing protein
MKQITFAFFFLLTSLLFSQSSLNMRQLAHWEDTTLVAEPLVGLKYNEVWGWANPVDGREYALIGSADGVHIIEVTDAANIHQVDFVKGRATGIVNRDIKTKGNFAYTVGDQKESSLQIFDLSYLPDSVHVVYDDTLLMKRSHSLWVEGNRLYAVNPNVLSTPAAYALGIYDISNPAVPVEITKVPSSLFGRTHVIITRNDTAFWNTGWQGMVIMDFKDPLNPQLIAQFLGYPYQGYNHTGWLHKTKPLYVMADETHGSPLKLVDISDIANPNTISLLAPNMKVAPPDTQAIAHNPFIVGNYVISSYYYQGVRIYDISNPQIPTEVAYFDTYPQADEKKFAGCWGVYPFLPSKKILASDMQTGLYVLEFSPFINHTTPSENSLNISLSPDNQFILLNANEEMTSPALNIYDTSGRLIRTHTWAEGTYNRLYYEANDLPNGLYILEIKTEKGQFWRGKYVK